MTLTIDLTLRLWIDRNANNSMGITDDQIILIVEDSIMDPLQLGNRGITTDSTSDVLHIDIEKMDLLIRVNQKKVRTNQTQRSTIKYLHSKSLTRSIVIVKHLDATVATVVDKSEERNQDDQCE